MLLFIIFKIIYLFLLGLFLNIGTIYFAIYKNIFI